jgi:glycosyltransferase involved in cell wall biosynthesis
VSGATFAPQRAAPQRGAQVKLTIVTPSFNQAGFIERTLASVAAQRGPFEVEHLVIDGGSTDGTLEVLRRHPGLRWISEPDRGQSDAINKGFRMATGDVVAWLNSDDRYEPGALAAAAEALGAGARWCFGECRVIDEDDREIRRLVSWYKNRQSRRYSVARLLGRNFIPQPAVFFRRDLLEEVGGLREDYHLAMDYDLWLRFARVAEPVFVPRPLAAFRWHGGSKSGAGYRRMAWECFGIARQHARPGEGGQVARHLLHVLSLVGAYGALDAVEPLTSWAGRRRRGGPAAGLPAAPGTRRR